MKIRGQLLLNAMAGMQMMVVGATEKTIWQDGAPTDGKELQLICFVYDPNNMEPQQVRITVDNNNENKKKVLDSIGQLIGTVDDLKGVSVEDCTTYAGKMMTEYIKLVAKGL